MTETEMRLYGKAEETIRGMSAKLLEYDRVCNNALSDRIINWLIRIFTR